MSKTAKAIFAIIGVMLVAGLCYLLASTMLDKSESYTNFQNYIENYIADTSDGKLDGKVEIVTEDGKTETHDLPHVSSNGVAPEIYKVVVNGYKVTGYLVDTNNFSLSNNKITSVTFSLFSNGNVVQEWAKGGVDVKLNDPNAGSIWGDVLYFGIVIIIGVVFIVLVRQSMGGGTKANSFSKSKTKATQNIKVRFSDVAGAEEEKTELAEIVEFLKNPKKFTNLGARTPRGVLLVGPPGTGKTLFAKAIAGEAGVPFFSASGSDFVEMFVGVGASRVRDLFENAKKNSPCIIFIDEIDAVGRERGAGLGGGNDEREQTLNQILVQMDGFDTNDGVIVIAATNRADILDPALLRPGRFDRQIYVNLPDVKGREAILKVHARNKPLAPDVNFKTVARLTVGFSGADLANLLNEAAILAARADKKMIGNKELYEGINKVIMGPQKKSRVVTEADKRVTAYHEAGHAIIAKLCPNCDNVQEVSIIPRGNAGGYTLHRPDDDSSYYSYNKFIDEICDLLGGRVAEELVIKDITSGASNDIQRATEIAKKMVAELGMSDKVGLVSYSSGGPVFIGRSYENRMEYSESTAALIDEEIKRIVEEQHKRATELLTSHKEILDNMARTLVERETIYSEEVDMLMQGKSVGEVISYMDAHDKMSQENPFERA